MIKQVKAHCHEAIFHLAVAVVMQRMDTNGFRLSQVVQMLMYHMSDRSSPTLLATQPNDVEHVVLYLGPV